MSSTIVLLFLTQSLKVTAQSERKLKVLVFLY